MALENARIPGGVKHIIDNVSVPASGAEASAPVYSGGTQRVRFVRGAATGADITFDIEGATDGSGAITYRIATAVADGAAIELADMWIRVTARNGSALNPETADCFLAS